MEFFTPIKQLKLLDLSGNRLKQIAANIPVNFPSLTYINLGFNKLAELNFSNWIAPKLIGCDLGRNYFTQLPVAIDRLTNLENILVPVNKLTILDLQQLENLQKLKRLNVAKNRLHTVLPDCRSLKKSACQRVLLLALEEVDLVKNYLTEIDFNLWDVPSLKSINLQNNRLQRLGIPFKMFPKLEKLFIENNVLSCLEVRSIETYIANQIVDIKVVIDKSSCSSNSYIKHPYENGIICCNL